MENENDPTEVLVGLRDLVAEWLVKTLDTADYIRVCRERGLEFDKDYPAVIYDMIAGNLLVMLEYLNEHVPGESPVLTVREVGD